MSGLRQNPAEIPVTAQDREVLSLRLYTAGYRDALTDKRLLPEQFYGQLPPEAVVVDIRSHPYSPFAPAYTGSGVAAAVERWKPGIKQFYPVNALGNLRRDASGKRISPPVYLDPETGFPWLETCLETHRHAVIFCACSYATLHSETHRCHRFFVAEEMLRRIPTLSVHHLPLTALPENDSLSFDML